MKPVLKVVIIFLLSTTHPQIVGSALLIMCWQARNQGVMCWQARNQGGGQLGNFPPPKFSKSCLVITYNVEGTTIVPPPLK